MACAPELHAFWPEAVYVQVGMHPVEIIHDPAEALAFLANSWSGSREKHEFAREICAAAVLGQVSSEVAREAFVEAAEDARMSIAAPNPNSS